VIVEAIVTGCQNGAEDVILQVQREIRNNLSQGGSGFWYWGNPARSSSPGEPPATQSGRLKNAWQAQPRKFGRARQIGWIIGAGRVPYAAILEFGGRAGRGRSVQIEERPYIRPAVEKVIPRAAQVFASYISAELKREIFRR
jgi:phage gpG-like protein